TRVTQIALESFLIAGWHVYRRGICGFFDCLPFMMPRWRNKRNVLHLHVAHFQRVIHPANLQNVLAGMNFIKVILPIGGCHCLANKVERLIRLHLEKRDSDSDKWPRKTDDISSQVGSTQYRGGHHE